MYKIIVTTPSHPRGVQYPPRGHPLYTREEAIAHMRTFVSRGHTSNYSKYGVYAEGENERFMLSDIDGSEIDKSI